MSLFYKKYKNKELRDRYERYYHISDILKKRSLTSKCSLDWFEYKRIGSSSVVGITLRVKEKGKRSSKKNELAVKVMHNYYQYEYKAYQNFKKLVLKGDTPHFCLTYDGLNCKDKCSFIDLHELLKKEDKENKQTLMNWKDIKENNCFLFFNELFDGDAISFIKDHSSSKKICSLIVQSIFGLYVIESSGLSHRDFHTGNILYKDISSNLKLSKDQYFKYIIDDETTYYVKHQQNLFVIWDLERIDKIKAPITQGKKWLSSHSFDDQLKPISGFYWDITVMCHFILLYYEYYHYLHINKSFKEFLQKLKEMFIVYTDRFSKGITVPSIKSLLHKIKDLQYINTVLFENIELDKDEISCTFDYRKFIH
jgi:hypothetical protein